jgi:DNA polymerase III subunit gamma/tau
MEETKDSFVVSARKYRPSTFHSVVGQQHITTTLKNAIKTHHLAQAFLFCGPRGVGKTTNARILAKTINCFNITEDIEACNICESCVSFNNGASLNIYELDAASNNSVDDIRQLVEQVRYTPQLGKYKVYIIDEVHMLSTSAFNAFLKTLEEPPAHAIFILATTEKHKIIPTILSRCQIFDFNRISVDDIAQHLKYIAGKEGVTAEPEALAVIAQKADGALRDSLSMFDQLVTFSGNNLTYKAVIENLNVLDYDYYFRIVDCMLKGDYANALLTYNQILVNGFESSHFISGLSKHFRNLMVAHDPITLQLLEVAKSVADKYKSQATQLSPMFILKALEICTQTEARIKTSIHPRILIELALIQLSAEFISDEKKKSEPVLSQNSESVNPTAEEKQLPASPAVTADSAQVQVVQEPRAGSDKSPETDSNPLPKKSALFGPPPSALVNKPAPTAESQELMERLKKREEAFSEDDLQQVWQQYLTQAKENEKIVFLNAVQSAEPRLKENNTIELMVPNALTQELISDNGDGLMKFLCDHLKNDLITITYKVEENITERKPYTDSEKFAYMAQKNPTLIELKKRLDLEI